MRNLYRGKRIDTNEWAHGVPIEKYGKAYIIDVRQSFLHSIYRKESVNDFLTRVYEVIPETVGQYTGLTDKNGVKIFEGDILNTTNSNYAIWYVDYKNTAFCCNQGNANYSCVLDEFMQYSDVEVIGNIHDNPELLEVK